VFLTRVLPIFALSARPPGRYAQLKPIGCQKGRHLSRPRGRSYGGNLARRVVNNS
jgi:hypothetical protein